MRKRLRGPRFAAALQRALEARRASNLSTAACGCATRLHLRSAKRYPRRMLRLSTLILAAVVITAPAHAGDRDANIRQFEVTLRSVGDKSGATPEQLQFVVANLTSTGSDPSDAFESVMEVITTPGINASAAETLAYLGRDIAAALRGRPAYWTRRLARSLSGRTDDLISFIFEITPNGMTADEAGKIRRADEKEGRKGAVRLGLAVIDRQFGGNYEKLRPH